MVVPFPTDHIVFHGPITTLGYEHIRLLLRGVNKEEPCIYTAV